MSKLNIWQTQTFCHKKNGKSDSMPNLSHIIVLYYSTSTGMIYAKAELFLTVTSTNKFKLHMT